MEPDGVLRPARVASSPGHLLASRLLDGPDVGDTGSRLIARLADLDLLPPLGTAPARRAPPASGPAATRTARSMDTGVIADCLRRHGQAAQATDLEQRILDACASAGGFPEFFRGDPDGPVAVNDTFIDAIVDGVPNRLEQPPQKNQAWTATRVWRILRQRGVLAGPGRVQPSAGVEALAGLVRPLPTSQGLAWVSGRQSVGPAPPGAAMPRLPLVRPERTTTPPEPNRSPWKGAAHHVRASGSPAVGVRRLLGRIPKHRPVASAPITDGRPAELRLLK